MGSDKTHELADMRGAHVGRKIGQLPILTPQSKCVAYSFASHDILLGLGSGQEAPDRALIADRFAVRVVCQGHPLQLIPGACQFLTVEDAAYYEKAIGVVAGTA